MESLLKLGKNIDCIPVIHGRSIFAQEVRKQFLKYNYECIAVELPFSLYNPVLEAVLQLPLITAVVYKEEGGEYCYVPCEPGEGIIEAIRLGLQERKIIEFIDMEVDTFPRHTPVLPDEYTIREVGLEEYYRSTMHTRKIIQDDLLELQETLKSQEPDDIDEDKEKNMAALLNDIEDSREKYMAARLRELDRHFNKILFVCGMAHLEGIKTHLETGAKRAITETPEYKPQILSVHSDSIYLLTGEIPYITFLYEKNRYSIDSIPFDKIDGIKELLLETRKEYCRDFIEEEERLTPGAMQALLNYLRNLSVMGDNLTPSMYDLVVASKGVGGGGFGARVVEMAKLYPYQTPLSEYPTIRMGIKTAWFEPVGEVPIKNRLPHPPFSLKSLRLEHLPDKKKQKKWKQHWGWHSECSWPQEDEKIENFCNYVKVKALKVLEEDVAKLEKFTTSIKDGLDIRETLRQWHTGDLYVKELPPVRGDVGAVLFIFDTNTKKYPWRSTWLAEHENESTLAFYATDHKDDIIGPGISRAFYGGALFIFPPIAIPDIWTNKRFDYSKPLLRITASGIHYSASKYIAYVAHQRPTLEMRNIAKRANKHLIYIPISNFSTYTIRKLRKFHVLQGHQVRSYAQKYIR